MNDPNATARKINHIRERAFALLDAAEMLENRPAEPGEGAAVIFFEKTFGKPEGPTFTYAAVRAGDGAWYGTGTRINKGITWDALMDFVISGEDPTALPEIFLATELTAL